MLGNLENMPPTVINNNIENDVKTVNTEWNKFPKENHTFDSQV